MIPDEQIREQVRHVLEDTYGLPALFKAWVVSYMELNQPKILEADVVKQSVPSARVFNNAALAIVTAVVTPLTFNSERWDNDAIHSTAALTTRLTCQTAGKYAMYGSLEWAANAAGERAIFITVNNAVDVTQTRGPNNGGVLVTGQSAATVYDLIVGDYVELRAYQTSGGNLNVNVAGNRSPEFGMTRIGD